MILDPGTHRILSCECSLSAFRFELWSSRTLKLPESLQAAAEGPQSYSSTVEKTFARCLLRFGTILDRLESDYGSGRGIYKKVRYLLGDTIRRLTLAKVKLESPLLILLLPLRFVLG